MSTPVPYQRAFSQYYDLLYSDNNYAAECDLIEYIFRQYLVRPRTLLDAGCGSGGHAIELTRRGYEVIGVDRSEGLLEIAIEKARSQNLEIRFELNDLHSFELDRRVDACRCMFAVLSFPLNNSDIQATLRKIHQSLAPGGLFVCDVWNGTAVLSEGTVPRLKKASKDGTVLLRFATPHLDTLLQTNVTTHHMIVKSGDRILDEVIEHQTTRYLVPQEFAFHLETAGFEVLKMYPFPKFDQSLSEKDWELGVVARAK